MRTLVSFLFFILAAASANAAVPPIDVTVSDESGKVVVKGVTNARGVFVTEKVKSGTYLVQLTSKNPAIRGHQYGLELSSGSANGTRSVPTPFIVGVELDTRQVLPCSARFS